MYTDAVKAKSGGILGLKNKRKNPNKYGPTSGIPVMLKTGRRKVPDSNPLVNQAVRCFLWFSPKFA